MSVESKEAREGGVFPGGIAFRELCSDVLLEIFKFLDLKTRTRLELTNLRLGELMPRLNTDLDDLRYRNFSGLSAKEEERMYLMLVKKSPQVRKFYFDLLRQDHLLVSLFADEVTVESYVANLVDCCGHCEEIRLMIYTCSEFSLYAALKFARAMEENRIRKIDLHLDHTDLEGLAVLGKHLLELVNLCSHLSEVAFVFYGPYDGGEWSADASRDARVAFDDFWQALALKLRKLTISYNDADIFFGHRHFTSNRFQLLEELTPQQELTGGYIGNIAANMPCLRKLTIETDCLEYIDHLTELDQLEEISWCYFTEENDRHREQNKRTFDKFIRKRGSGLKKLELKIPFQVPDFFELISIEHCPKLRCTNVNLSGTTKRHFCIDSVTSIYRIRKLSLTCKLELKQIEAIFQRCQKLKKLSFYIPAYEKANLPKIKQLVMDFVNQHPRRAIEIKQRFCGGSYITEFEKAIENNCTFYLDNGRQISDFWED